MRRKRPSLRGSVTQNAGSVRMRADNAPRFGLITRLGIGGSVLLVLTLTALWLWHSGWVHRQAVALQAATLRLTKDAHFVVNDIVVEGRQQTGKDQLYVALDAASGSPLFAFDPAEAEARIAKLPWVASVIVERRLPDTVYVHLTERVPLARWQRDNRLAVIDTQGKILGDANPEQFTELPLVVGAGAPAETKKLIDMLRSFPAVHQNVAAIVRVGERRWDLRLQPKIVARLPETDIADALKRLSILITEQKILERDIIAIDLRIADRLIIEPSSEPPPRQPTTGNSRL